MLDIYTDYDYQEQLDQTYDLSTDNSSIQISDPDGWTETISFQCDNDKEY